jgi:hypothetical protein
MSIDLFVTCLELRVMRFAISSGSRIEGPTCPTLVLIARVSYTVAHGGMRTCR